jgi:hypothetical protein
MPWNNIPPLRSGKPNCARQLDELVQRRSALAIPLETANKNKGQIRQLQEHSTFVNAIILGAIPQPYRSAGGGSG